MQKRTEPQRSPEATSAAPRMAEASASMPVGRTSHLAQPTTRRAALVAAAILTSLLAITAAAPANAAVLHSAIPKRLVCGDAIVAGIWAQAWTEGDRTVRMTATDRKTGRVWWRKKARAPKSNWREWHLPSGMDGQCGRTTFVYRGAGWKAVYRIRFRSEGV